MNAHDYFTHIPLHATTSVVAITPEVALISISQIQIGTSCFDCDLNVWFDRREQRLDLSVTCGRDGIGISADSVAPHAERESLAIEIDDVFAALGVEDGDLYGIGPFEVADIVSDRIVLLLHDQATRQVADPHHQTMSRIVVTTAVRKQYQLLAIHIDSLTTDAVRAGKTTVVLTPDQVETTCGFGGQSQIESILDLIKTCGHIQSWRRDGTTWIVTPNHS